jgi:hypothetical protein
MLIFKGFNLIDKSYNLRASKENNEKVIVVDANAVDSQTTVVVIFYAALIAGVTMMSTR